MLAAQLGNQPIWCRPGSPLVDWPRGGLSPVYRCTRATQRGLLNLVGPGRQLAPDHRKAATRAACSAITRALSSSGVPAGSPFTLTSGFDQTGRRGQPPQLSL